jgi:hypothetical protein
MKLPVLLFAAFFLLEFASHGQSQTDMTVQSGEATKKAEKKLDSIYKSVIKIYSKDTLFIKSFTSAQSFWKKYYNYQVKAMFPNYPDFSDHYGSMMSMCVTSYARTIVEQRIKELEKWLIGDEQGDCDSSVKSEDALPKYDVYIPFTPPNQ